MASRIFDRGLQVIGGRASSTADAFLALQVMSVDDLNVVFGQTNDQLNDRGAVTNMYDQAFDATPTRSAQTVTHVMTIPTGSGNFVIRNIAIHNDTIANVTTSSTTLVLGIDSQSLTKDSSFTLAITVRVVYTSV